MINEGFHMAGLCWRWYIHYSRAKTAWSAEDEADERQNLEYI